MFSYIRDNRVIEYGICGGSVTCFEALLHFLRVVKIAIQHYQSEIVIGL